jgi:pyruvate ferredoxin oxidoreductase alpha subunit
MLNDQTDSIMQRDTGWLQLYCETVQEILDTVIQGYKIVENPAVKIPLMVCADGYWLTHSLENITLPTQKQVDAFLPPYRPGETDYISPGGLSLFTSFGLMDNWFSEFKYQERAAISNALKVIEEVDAEFASYFGRSYSGLLDAYRTEGAEVVIVGMGSIMATVRYAVDIMRSAGRKVGMVKIRSFRPFPQEKLLSVIGASKARMLVVLEKTHFGALFDEVRSALYDLDDHPRIMGYGVGLNGRNVEPYNIIDLFEQAFVHSGKASLPKGSRLYFIRTKDKGVGG